MKRACKDEFCTQRNENPKLELYSKDSASSPSDRIIRAGIRPFKDTYFLMKTFLLTASVILLFSQTLFAQNNNASLLVQSPNGKKVMLVWFLKTWNNEITGFDIKRKEGLQDWVKLNSEPITPGISMKKKLSIVDADKNEKNKLEARLYKLLATRKLKETENTPYLQKLLADEQSLHEMSDMMAHDYEFALMNGFAYIDYTVTKKTDYQYGLFIQGTDKLLAKASWNYGEIPDLNTVTEITSKATTKVKGVQLIWNADITKMKTADVAGFNVYRQGIRLNTSPVIPTDSKDPSEFTWYDKSANSAQPIQYSISAESIFGIEGIIKSYTYNPDDHPSEYKKAEVTEVTSLGYYMKDGVSIKWTFPKEHERFLKGFYLEKDKMPAGYTRVSPLLEPSTRAYLDKSPSAASSYMRFRVVAVYADRTPYPGIERVYSYFPVAEPPTPQNVKAKFETGNKKNIVHLIWDAPMNGDVVTDHYKVYVGSPASEKFYAVNDDHPVRANNYNYTIREGGPGTYKFYVSSVSRSQTEGTNSDTVSIQFPGSELPVPVITKVVADSNSATVQWQYPDIPVLRGFRLIVNKNTVANEDELKKNVREFIIHKLEHGATYEVVLQAISVDGVLSGYSKPYSINLPTISK